MKPLSASTTNPSMISGFQSIQDSLLRYCLKGELVIASGNDNEFNTIYYKTTVPYFEVTDTSYWVLDKRRYKAPQPETGGVEADGGVGKEGEEPPEKPVRPRGKVFKTLTISGKIDMANYHQVFTSFVYPLAKNGVEIEIRIRGRSTENFPITENSYQYRITKESAKQLGLRFEVGE